MKLKIFLLFMVVIGFSTTTLAQPTGTVYTDSDDISFGSESVVTVSPENIAVTMELRSSTESEETMLGEHLEAQTNTFAALDSLGVSFQGQVESEFELRKNTRLVRRIEIYTVTSSVSAVALTDEQLLGIANLIDSSDELSLVDYSLNYKPEDSLEEIEKNVINSLIGESQKYQSENNTRLTPKGISKMDILTEPFGDEILSELLEDNDFPRDTSFSASAIELIGIQYQISAELLFH